MTKYEWETALKKNICRLPDDEIGRVMEYYDELFEDYIERGKTETAIINEFGNPVDVAEKILSEYDGEFKSETVEKKPDSVFEGHADNVVFNVVEHENTEDSGKNCETVEQKDGADNEQKRSDTTKAERAIVFIVLNVLTGFTFFVLFAVVWIVFAVFVMTGASLAVGGGGAVVISFGVMCNGYAGSGVAQLGMGLVCIGIGIALTIAAVKVVKPIAAFTRKCFNGITKWLVGKRGA